MGVVVPRTVAEFKQARSPEQFKAMAMQKIGDLSGIDVLYNMVLLAIYIRSEVTGGGIIRPDMNVEEDVWQGKAGLVLKLGANAFEDDGEYSFKGQKVDVGEWCGFKVGDAWSLELNGVACRLVRDSAIKLKLKDPRILL